MSGLESGRGLLALHLMKWVESPNGTAYMDMETGHYRMLVSEWLPDQNPGQAMSCLDRYVEQDEKLTYEIHRVHDGVMWLYVVHVNTGNFMRAKAGTCLSATAFDVLVRAVRERIKASCV